MIVQSGALCGVTKPGGSAGGPGGRWSLELDPVDQTQTVAGFHFGEESFVTGEYVSLTLPDGEQHTYVVARVQPL